MPNPHPQPKPPEPTLFPAQIVLRTDQQTRLAFKSACQDSHSSMQDALALFVEATIAHNRDRSIRHLDGSLCPIAALIDALAISVRHELTGKPTPPQP